MRKMKRLIIIIIAVLFFVGCAALTTGKEYSYTLIGAEDITDEQVKEIKSKIDQVYKYFDDKGYELSEVKFIMANNTRIDHPKDEIIIDFENISDFELIQIILQHEFSDYLNYGLMYGVIYDIAKTYDLEFEEVNNYSIEEIEEYWDYMFLSYINFTPEIASESEVKIAKYVAIELVDYILDTYGNEYLFDLMRKSSELVHANKVSEILDEWIENKGSDFTDIRIVNREVFNQNPKDNTIAFSTENIYWILDLSNKELLSDYYPNLHDNAKTFYDYMNIFYEEILRLEEVLSFDSSKLPDLIVEIYNGVYNDTGVVRFYNRFPPKISLDTVTAFSHEFVHFVDYSFNPKFKYKAYTEMRAVYYSRNFQLDFLFNIGYKAEMEDIKKNELILMDPLAEAEKYLGRSLNQDDYFLLFNDLLIHTFIESGEEIPNLFSVSEGRYARMEWISLLNFIDRTYGEEALDTIMFEEKLPDGTMKNITNAVEEWKIYITNLTEDDYGDYYD